MKKIWILLAAALIFSGCSRNDNQADAYGNFQAVETLISAESSGKLLSFNIDKGQSLHNGELVAVIDTTLYVLQKQELQARKSGAHAGLQAAEAQIDVISQQLENVLLNLKRVQKMAANNAATQKQLDDVTTQEKVLRNQLKAAHAQKSTVAAELQAIDSRAAQLDEQLVRCRIINPIDGTVLEKYAQVFELTAAGKPLYKIANLDEIEMLTFVSGGELQSIKLGASCTVRIDNNDDYMEFPGRVTWISDKAEFTPKIIQTKKERVNLVYAVKILVENDGRIKIGMPGEVLFN